TSPAAPTSSTPSASALTATSSPPGGKTAWSVSSTARTVNLCVSCCRQEWRRRRRNSRRATLCDSEKSMSPLGDRSSFAAAIPQLRPQSCAAREQRREPFAPPGVLGNVDFFAVFAAHTVGIAGRSLQDFRLAQGTPQDFALARLVDGWQRHAIGT